MSRISSRTATIACAALLLLFATLCYLATSSKSATYDEPVHAAAAYEHLTHGDFTPNPEHPPLWKYWAAIPWLFGPPVVDHRELYIYQTIPSNTDKEWGWAIGTLYQTPGNDPDVLIGASRGMMLVIAVALGLLITAFAGKAGGSIAAIVSCTLYCLDPNFLAHGSLVTNDVSITLSVLAVTYVLWLCGQRLTWPRAATLCLLCGATVTTKFTGALAGPMVLLALCARAMLPADWPVLGRALRSRAHRLAAALLISLACGVVAYTCIWAAYLFRFAPTPDPSVHFDRAAVIAEIARSHDIPESQIPAWTPTSPVVRATLIAMDHHLLPEAYLRGLLHAYHRAEYRFSYLLGQYTSGGHWYYFPLAFLVKTPVATLAAILLLPVATLWLLNPQSAIRNPRWLWLFVCLAAPILIFGLSSICSNLNIGLRHIFPIYPPLFIATGILAARLYAHKPQAARNTLLALAALLSIESLGAFPNFIPFFNYAAGGPEGGLRLLGDSNLDWGQDLRALRQWQLANPARPLYLAYFGTADPSAYQIDYHNLPHAYAFGAHPPEPLPTHNAVIAISATLLQRALADPSPDNPYAPLRALTPSRILNGSIYIYELQ